MEKTINLNQFVNILNEIGVEKFVGEQEYGHQYHELVIEFDKSEVKEDSSEYDGIKFYIPETKYHLDFKVDEDDNTCTVYLSDNEDSFGRRDSWSIGIGQGLYEDDDKLEVIVGIYLNNVDNNIVNLLIKDLKYG